MENTNLTNNTKIRKKQTQNQVSRMMWEQHEKMKQSTDRQFWNAWNEFGKIFTRSPEREPSSYRSERWLDTAVQAETTSSRYQTEKMTKSTVQAGMSSK